MQPAPEKPKPAEPKTSTQPTQAAPPTPDLANASFDGQGDPPPQKPPKGA